MIGKNTSILLDDGTLRFVEDLRAGDVVSGGHVVKTIVEHLHGPFDLAVVHPGLRISMKHPIKAPGTEFWVFPIHNAHSYQLDVDEPAYDIVLHSGHEVTADGIICKTLGHNSSDPVAKHDYYGTDKIIHDLGDRPWITIRDLTVLRNMHHVAYKWIF